VALVLNTVYLRIGVILMTLLLPHSSTLAAGITCHDVLCGDTEVGMYGVAMRFLEVLVIIPVYFMNSVLPIMTRFIEEKNQRIRELMQYSFDFLVATGIPILVGAYVLAVPIIMFISSPEFISGHEFVYGADYAVKILMFAMFFSFINSLFGFTLLVLNQQVKLMYINAACVVLNVVSNLFVIPVWGFRGAAFTSVVSEVFILICAGWAAKNALGFSISGKTLGKLLLSACTMGVFISLGFHWMTNLWYVWQLAVLVPLGGVVYGAMVYFTGAVSPDMLKHLKKS
jgi:O-antigen/teichoic acid export membrane protein